MVTIAGMALKPHSPGKNMDEPEQTSGPPPTPETIFRDHAPRIYNLARRLMSNDADAEDVTQEVLLQVLRKLHTYRGDAALPTWLHRITVNTALAHRKKKARRDVQPLPDPLEEQFTHNGHHHMKPVRPWGGRPDQAALDRESHQVIEAAIAKLPENYRDVYVLSDVEGVPNSEIGEMLDLNLPAVKSRLHRARLLMRDALAPYFEEVTA